jgi:pimeloyl-ACP methyl ester carboxylesterase
MFNDRWPITFKSLSKEFHMIRSYTILFNALALTLTSINFLYGMPNCGAQEAWKSYTPETAAAHYKSITQDAECFQCTLDADKSSHANIALLGGVKTGIKQVTVDNNGQPVKLAYLEAGDKDNNIGTIFYSDSYFGKEGGRIHAIKWALQGFHVIAVDPLEAGLSSHNDPLAMDGIGGFQGYSYQQTAYLYRLLLISLGVRPNTPQQPIVFVGSSFDAVTGLVYASLYQNDPHGPSFYVGINPVLSAATTNNPCQLGALTPEFAEQLAVAYEADRCGILTLLYGGANEPGVPGNFTEIRCPIYGNFLLKQAVEYGALTPPAVFRRQVVSTLAFDPAPLMATITIKCLIVTGGIYQQLINKQNFGLAFYGICFACQPGCANLNYVLPIPDIAYKTYQDAGIAIQVTRVDEFNDDVAGLVTGNAGKCDPYLALKVDAKFNCQTQA